MAFILKAQNDWRDVRWPQVAMDLTLPSFIILIIITNARKMTGRPLSLLHISKQKNNGETNQHNKKSKNALRQQRRI